MVTEGDLTKMGSPFSTKNVDICKEAGIPCHLTGDAKEVTRAMESIADAVEVAMTI